MGYVKSPCINICRLNENQICIGCYRTIKEIAEWTKYTDMEKQNIINLLASRVQGELDV